MNILAGLEFRRIEIYRISSQWLFAHPTDIRTHIYFVVLGSRSHQKTKGKKYKKTSHLKYPRNNSQNLKLLTSFVSVY